MKEQFRVLYEQIKAKKINSQEAIKMINELREQNKNKFHNENLEEGLNKSFANEEVVLEKAITYFKELLSSELKLPGYKIQEDALMERYGIDSVMVIQMTERLEKIFGPLPKTLFFEYQTIKALTKYFMEAYHDKLYEILEISKIEAKDTIEKVKPSPIAVAEVKAKTVRPRKKQLEEVAATREVASKGEKMDIAIIGVAGKYPQAKDITKYWENLKEGKDCITDIPKERWDYNLYYDKDKNKPGKTDCKWGGFIDGVFNFDPLFFNISPREAEQMDPQERLFLECVYKTIEDAGYTKETFSKYKRFGLEGNVGVFVGVMYEEYQLYGAQEQARGNMISLNGNPSSIANRVSYYFNFHGPSMAVDTMCSSSLTAIHLACESLQNSGCEMAIAGGVNVSVHPNKYLLLGKNNFLSSKGKCESFGEGGNGYVPGEGVGSILLKPLNKAVEDGDYIYGVIKGTTINHGGKTNGFTVPNPNAQAEVIGRTYKEAGINPRRLSYIEAHGTGTSLGDPIEIAGLNKAFGEYTKDKQFCKIGSVKSNIGHAESAAGIASVTKVLLQMKHKQLVPSLNSEVLNPNIDFSNSPFTVQRELEEWKRPVINLEGEEKEYPLLAGISAFGAGGSNAHVIIEEYMGYEEEEALDIEHLSNQIFVISAKNEKRLKDNVIKFKEYIEKVKLSNNEETHKALFDNIAYTLQVGREAMGERLAIIASNFDELNEKLVEYINGTEYIQNLYVGNTKTLNIKSVFEGKASEEFLKILMKNNELHKIAELWVSGIKIQWNLLYEENANKYKPRRISIPTYSFAEEIYFPKLNRNAEIKQVIIKDEVLPKIEEDDYFYVPKWEQIGSINSSDELKDSEKSRNIIFIYHEDCEDLTEEIQSFYKADNIIKVKLDTEWKKISPSQYKIDINDPQSFVGLIKDINGIDTIYYMGGIERKNLNTTDINYLDFKEKQGVIGMFRLIKALAKGGYASKKITFKLITNNIYKILSEDICVPYAASIFGLVKSMEKEFLGWKATGIDIDLIGEDIKSESFRKTLKALVNENTSVSFSEVAIREGVRYIRKVYPINLPTSSETQFKDGGAYFIVGGAGGIGLELCLYLSDRINCKFALIGRSEPSSKIKETIELIESKGSKVIYLQADATNNESMEKAVKDTKLTFGKIDGAIHSAIVLRDQGLINMEEETFSKVISPKVTGSVVLHDALKNEKLDFLMYFSSVQSFAGNSGQSNYAAGCAFKDAFAQYERETTNYPIKLVNWGYWGEVGVVAKEEYNKRLAAMGIYPLKTDEGMDALERLLKYDGSQVLVIKADKKIMETMGADYSHSIHTYEEVSPSIIESLNTSNMPTIGEGGINDINEAFEELRDFSRLLLLEAFQKEKIFIRKNEKHSHKELLSKLKVIKKYERLFEGMLSILVNGGYITKLNDDEYISNEIIESEALKHDLLSLKEKKDWICENSPIVAPYVDFIWVCAPHDWEIIRGERLATEIIFPNASMSIVEKTYKDNKLSDYLNEIVTWALRSYIEKRYRELPEGKTIKILEIGAGTGGTSSVVFKGIKEYKEKLEYYYTDISEAFLKHGKTNYGGENPYVKFKLFNVEKEVLNQEFNPGDFDVVIATNVLHATLNIKNTIKNAKVLLKKNGWLIVNEITRVEDFLTLTFGLLDGWWLYEDDNCRLKGSPLLSNELWSSVLNEEGYRNVKAFGQLENSAIKLTQNVIVSESNGEAKIAINDKPVKEVKEEKEAKVIENNKKPTKTVVTKKVNSIDLEDGVEGAILDSLSEVLQIDKNELDIDMPYEEYGVDSILSGQIINLINEKLNIDMNSTALFNYPTSIKLRNYILEKYKDKINLELETIEVEEEESVSEIINDKPIQVVKEADYSGDSSMDIAIVGMSGVFPGANTLDEYWDNLINGINSVDRIDRWDEEEYYDPNPGVPDKSYINRTGLLSDMDKFDPLFFNISPKEAEVMDPQQRLFLEEAWKALEDAGLSDKYLDERKCGVFVGCMENYYEKVIEKSGVEKNNYVFNGITIPILSARISYLLNLRGPSIVVSTACSSTLVALHLACESIINKTSEIAIAGGVNTFATTLFHTVGSSTGMFSYTGECRPFDDNADGFIPAEACGAVILKPLNKARQDGDHIYGVIVGSSINQDGKSNGITAPSAPSQAALEYEVYSKYDINPEHISYIEAHGTGTKLGDPIEIEALSEAFSKFTDKKQFCPIGSVKSNIGHALQGAGAASLIKVLLCMQHKKLVPSINFNAENSLIPFKDSPVYVNTEYKDWIPPEGVPRMAAISAFGISGTNSHLVIKEYIEEDYAEKTVYPYNLIALSAKSEDDLRNKIKDLAKWLDKDNYKSNLSDIAYTLMVGRSHFSYRTVFIVKTIDELKGKLALALEGIEDKNYIVGEFISNNFRVDRSIKEKGQKAINDLSQANLSNEDYIEKFKFIGELFVKGYIFEWTGFYDSNKNKKLSLPTYPFANESYWVEENPNSIKVESKKTTRLHPLIEKNTATLREQKYSTVFHEEEFYISGHEVNSQKVMPGVAYLEMARAAGELAAEEKVQSISNVLWGSPIIVHGQQEVHIGLYPNDDDEVEFEVYTIEDDERISHAQGILSYEEEESTYELQDEVIDIEKIKDRCTDYKSSEDCYNSYKGMGFNYDSNFQAIDKIYSNGHEALAHLKLPKNLNDGFKEFGIHPSIVDGALQSAIGLVERYNISSEATYLPFLIGEVKLIKPLTTECYAYITPNENGTRKNTNELKFNISITNNRGEVLANIINYNVREFQKSAKSLELLEER